MIDKADKKLLIKLIMWSILEKHLEFKPIRIQKDNLSKQAFLGECLSKIS